MSNETSGNGRHVPKIYIYIFFCLPQLNELSERFGIRNLKYFVVELDLCGWSVNLRAGSESTNPMLPRTRLLLFQFYLFIFIYVISSFFVFFFDARVLNYEKDPKNLNKLQT